MRKYSLNALGIEVTRRCNKACAHCMKGTAQNITISKETVDNVFEDISDVARIILLGGEPFLEIGMLSYIVEQATDSDWTIRELEVTTNGTIYDKRVVDIFEEFCKSRPDSMVIIRVSTDPFHNPDEYERALAYYEPLVKEANLRIEGKGIFLWRSTKPDEKVMIAYSGNARNLVDSGTTEYQHLKNVNYCFPINHRIKIIDYLIPCLLDVYATGDIGFNEQISYEFADMLSIGNINKQPFNKIIDQHNAKCMVLCSESNMLTDAIIATKDKEFVDFQYGFPKFKELLFKRILSQRERIRDMYPILPAQSIISALPFYTMDELIEIAEWMLDNVFGESSLQILDFRKDYYSSKGTDDEDTKLRILFRLLVGWIELTDEVIMPPRFQRRERAAFERLIRESRKYNNPCVVPVNSAEYPCKPDDDGNIQYSTKVSTIWERVAMWEQYVESWTVSPEVYDFDKRHKGLAEGF